MISNSPPRIFTPKTPMQRHVAFFDGNKDGKVTYKETREGLGKLGMGGAAAVFAGAFINFLMGPMTSKKATTTID
ncbi:MAG: putative peroxygenase 5 isoform, partial [Cyanobacteria bacterium RYN_339]|nr:putative peroxygenase 5 isoform [Cyanobacteria bacterium RYN_339]